MPLFTANYPTYPNSAPTLLSTPERTGALPTYTGQGIVIAFIDSGFYPHPDIASRVLMHVDATARYAIESTASRRFQQAHNYSWHGQMTSVIAAGDGSVSAGRYRGIASGAQLVLIKVSNLRWEIKEDDILRGLQWVNANHQRFNIRVVNLSVGGDFVSADPQHPIYELVRGLTDGGVVVVAAAGNQPVERLVPPASSAEAITVGGLDDQNTLDHALWVAYGSNYGSAYDGSAKPDLLAPARWIPSPILPGTTVAREAQWLGPLLQSSDAKTLRRALRQGYEDFGLTWRSAAIPNDEVYNLLQERIHTHKLIDANHQHVDGTSVAAPIVSAVVAQMLEVNPQLTPAQIKQILVATARRVDTVPTAQQGGGALNAPEAVQRALGA